jgi:hypothetical protein
LSLWYRYDAHQTQGQTNVLISHDYDRWLWIYYREHVSHWRLSLSILLTYIRNGILRGSIRE